MISISAGLIASPPEDEPLNFPTMGWHNVVTPSNIAAGSEATDFPDDNLANPATYLYWKGASAAQTYVTVTTTGLGSLDYIAVAGHNFGSAGISVTPEANTGGGYSALITGAVPPNDAPVIYRFAPASNRTGIRLNLGAGSEAPRAAVVYVGKLTIFERGTQGGYTPLTHGIENTVINGESESGNYLGRIVTGAVVKSSAEFKYMTPSWYRTYLQPFVDASVVNPFFFAWQPIGWPNETGYAWLREDPLPVIDMLGYFHIQLDMTGIVS